MARPLHPSDDNAAARDFRQYIEELQQENDLLEIFEEVDPHLEVAAITRKAYETEDKAPLFNRVKGQHSNGLFRILGAPVGASKLPGKRFIRIAKSLGLPSTATAGEIIQKIHRTQTLPKIYPREVPTGPVKEFKWIGDEIDLEALPIPLLHGDDGGKFIQTFGMFIVETPDKSWVNWSITRAMVHGKNTLVGPMIPRQDIGTIRELWSEKNQDMPFSLCFGVPPAAIMVGGMPLPKGVNEAEFIGALTGSPVEVTKSETNDILVPANAEIVFEGTVSRTRVAQEGPMAEYPGIIFPGQSKECPIFEINAITFRKDPILPICVTGRAPEESETVWGLMIAAQILTICQQAGLPVDLVWNPFESHCCWYVVQINTSKLKALETNMDDFSRRVGDVIFGSKPGYYAPVVYLVGDDIDPTNLKDVVWANATRCQPKAQEYFFDEYPTIGLVPYVSHGVKVSENPYKVVRCCLFPGQFQGEKLIWREASFRGNYPQEVQDKVNSKWNIYGF